MQAMAGAACALLAACAQVSLNEAPVVDLSVPAGGRAPALAPQAAPSGAAPAAGYYTVQPGDTLYHIATLNHIAVADLARWNGIGETTPIAVGLRLRVQAPAAQAAPMTPAVAGAAESSAVQPGPEANAVPISNGETVQTRPLDAVPPSAPAAPVAPAAPSAEAPAAAPVTPTALATTSPGAANGWIWPVDGRVVVNFDPVHGQGIDIATAEDAPVVAVADGEVTYTGSPRDYGNLITIRHAGDMLSVYAHDKSILVKQGDMVKRGQTIATAGTTIGGVATLHFEIRQKGVPVDPLGYLPIR